MEKRERGGRREPTCFYMFSGVAKAFRAYARLIKGKKVGDVIEEALIYYMENHPIEKVNVIIQKLEFKLPNIQERINEKLLRVKISHAIKMIDEVNVNGVGSRDFFQRDLMDCLGQAIKISNPSKDMVALMEIAEDYIDV